MSERKTWLEDEDRILKMLVEERGIRSWAQISRVMGEQFGVTGRSGKQCRQRYHNHLDTRIKHGPWTRQEEHLLVAMQDKFGNRWADISRAIAGRSQNSVKNKYFSIVRRGVRVLNTAIRKQLKKYKELEMQTVREIVDSFDPTTSQELLSADHISCADIKKRLLFYGLRDEALPFATEDYVDIKRLIDDIRLRRKNLNNSQKIEQSLLISAEETGSKQTKEEIFEKEDKKVNLIKEVQEVKREQVKEEKVGMGECILSLKRMSLQSLGLEPLQQEQESNYESRQNGMGHHMISPIMSKKMSSKSMFSNIDHRQIQQEGRPAPADFMLRKDSTLKSFEFPQLDYIRSPFMMIDSPHFDQVPSKNSFNSWSYLFHQ